MFEIEEKLVEEGNKYIIGIDEVGRGPLLGDVVACAVCVTMDDKISGIRDSKKLSDKKRRILAKEIKERAVDFSISGAPPDVIDKINILNATKLSMQNALNDLAQKLKLKNITPDVVLVDSVHIETDLNVISLDKGDDLCYSIGCASILAKVYRDNLCEKWDEEYPGYNLKKNKGYGTKEHREALVELGPCAIHRKSFLKNIEKWRDESTAIGKLGEDKAARYLVSNGYEILDRNYKTRFGEIDIIAKKDEFLVFVEVKFRKNANYGHGYEAVDEIKQKKIKETADYYYISKEMTNFQPRFDVIEIYSDETINHYENAFC